MVLWRISTCSSLIAFWARPACTRCGTDAGFWASGPVDVVAAIGDRGADNRTGLGGRDEADQDGGHLACPYRGSFAARGRNKRANRVIRDADGAGIATRRAGPGATVGATRADLSAKPAGTGGCLSALFSGPQCSAGLHGNLRAGIPAERHGDRAPDELLLASRLAPRRPGLPQRLAVAQQPDRAAGIHRRMLFISRSRRRHSLRSRAAARLDSINGAAGVTQDDPNGE